MPTTEPGGRWDPLGPGVRLSHTTTFWPLGFRLDVASNDARALELVERAFPGRDELFPEAGLALRIAVGEGESCGVAPVYRASAGY